MTASEVRMNIVDVGEQSAALLPGIIGFFFSFRVVIVLLMVRLFQVDPQTSAIVSLALNYLLLVVVIFNSLGSSQASPISILRVSCFRWVLLFLGFSLCSLLWTAAVSTSAALAYWCAMAADVAIVVLLLRDGADEAMIKGLIKGYVAATCLIALIAWIMPSQSDLRLGDEELLGPNQIGYVCAFAIFLAQYLIHKGASHWKLPAAFLAITLLRSLSKTTIIAFLVAEAFILMKNSLVSRKAKIGLVFATCLVIAVFWNLLGAYYDVYTNAGNQSETLTGRIGIWAVILDKALEQPWIGHGFHSVWKVIPPFVSGTDVFEARHAHNELLQQFYAYGVAGIVMLAGLYGSFYREIRTLPVGQLRRLYVGLLLFVLIRGLADTEVFDLSLPLWVITLIGVTVARLRVSGKMSVAEVVKL